jgi:hypothetical protein
MQSSLKIFIHNTLAQIIGRKPVTLYERQRPLVAAGLLDAEGGHGPGSGVKASPRSVAMLLISLLATDSPSDTDTVATFAKLKCLGGHPCGLTGKATLADALTAILEMDRLPPEVWLQVERSRNHVIITYNVPDGYGQSFFTKGGKAAPEHRPGLHGYMAMHEGLHAISKALKG